MSIRLGRGRLARDHRWAWFGLGIFCLGLGPASAWGEPVQVAVERAVSLDELLAFAMSHAPAIRIAEERRAQGAAARDAASMIFQENPRLELSVGPRFERGRAGDYDYVVSLSQPVEIGGQRSGRREAASRLDERLAAEVGATRWEIRQGVVIAYADAVSARRQIELEDRFSRLAEAITAASRRRVEAGVATVIELRLAENEGALGRQRHLAAEQALRSARSRLAEVAGWPMESPPVVHAGLDVWLVPELEGILGASSRRHPTLLALRAAVAEAAARRQLADREGWPTPAFGAELVREGSVERGIPSDLILLGTIGVDMPFWQRNQLERARSRVDEAVAREEEAAAARALVGRIIRAHGELVSADRRLALFIDEIEPTLESNLELLRRGFEAGELSQGVVASASRRLLEAQRDGLEAFAEYFRALAELEGAAGVALIPNTVDPSIGGPP